MRRETTLSFPESSACLTGHFPGDPIVPAAAILAALVAWAERELGRKVAGVESARFRKPLPPGVAWRVVLEERKPGTVSMTANDQDQDHSAMSLRLRVEPA